jgi:hypothetical protein
VGSLAVTGGTRPLWVFVMMLAYSRAMWAELVFDLTVESLRRSLVRAAAFHCHKKDPRWHSRDLGTAVLRAHVGPRSRMEPSPGMLAVLTALGQVRTAEVSHVGYGNDPQPLIELLYGLPSFCGHAVKGY